ncbi:MAG: protein translocase subunit SecD [Miltoncostaeaceae bacterium]
MLKRPLLLIAIVLGLLAASVVSIVLRPTVLGLDLQGGVEVVLQGQPTEEADVTPEAIERSVEIIRSRVDAFGVAEPEIQTQGADQIVVALPGAEDPERVVSDLIQPAQLVFINFSQNVIAPDEGTPDFEEAITTAQRADPDSTRGRPALYALDPETGDYISGPEFDPVALEETLEGDTVLADVRVERVPAGVFLAYTEEAELQTRESSNLVRNWFVFNNNPGLTGADVTESRAAVQTRAGGGNESIVTMQFTDDGRRKFADVTRQLALDGSVQGELLSFAIILDGEIVSTPTIDFQEYPFGIDGRNGAQIQGDFSTDEADTLAKQINSGALPITLEVISQKQVSATLGAESLRQGLVAGLIGLFVVVLFLIAYYRFLGLVAAMALVVYALLLFAAIELVPITLTLPGIAGIILTIGVASDANVVIFERVREESRAGKSPKAAILAGYRKGITAIIDANVVTLATAAILFLFATAGVRGFAFTLLIGTVLSLFTAVVATQAVFGVLAQTRFLRDDRYMGFNQREIRWRFDFVGRWKLWLAISFLPLALGAAWIGTNGLNLGLDFTGGTRISSTFDQQPSEDAVRALFAQQGFTDARIQGTTEEVDDQTVQGFQIQVRDLQPDEATDVRRALDAEFGVTEETYQLETVGPVFGEQILRNAVIAILLSFIVLIIYLTIRFEYKLALPALLSVVQDVAFAVSVYSLTGREVTSATVAALLAILGYSLYDVVIVFDRIRENVPLMRKASYRQIVNTSTHEVLNRSLITSFTTLLPLLVLFLFGGDTLKDFAFALMVGILSGGVSSIVISAPVAAIWKERDPEYRKRSSKAERRALRVASDSDVADLDVLERAELGLAAQIAAEEGESDAEPDSEDEPGERPRRLGAGRRRPPDDEDPDASGDATDDGTPVAVVPEDAPGAGPEEPGTGDDEREDIASEGPVAGDGEGAEPGGEPSDRPAGRRRSQADPARPRRHEQVQRRKRR